MGKRLRDNITSQYIEAANHLSSQKARRRIVAYVESYDDIYFWRTILSRFETKERYFEVMLPSRLDHLERGKKAAIMSLIAGGAIGKDMIACVDADYDYLQQGTTYTSKSILENPYIFHTYAYAIENMQCYAPSLHEICVAATLNDHVKFDFEAFMRDYSVAIYPLFVWNIWSYRTSSLQKFSITDFLHAVEMGNLSPDSASSQLATLRRRVNHRINTLQRQHPEARDSFQKVKDDLRRLGVRPEQTYMYIQGHHLFDKIVMPLLKKVCNQLMREREREISRQSVHATQYRNELACYSSSVGDVELMLRRNTGFTTSEQYQRITADLASRLETPIAQQESHAATESSPEKAPQTEKPCT
mgnify:CR=1 FL=1